MKLSEFNYEYPEELIATHPLRDRDASKMMVVDRGLSSFGHSFVKELPSFLKKNDVVIINDTRVFPARLVGKKESGGYFEILLLGSEGPEPADNNELRTTNRWRCITNQTKTARPGLRILFGAGLIGTIVSRDGEELLIEFDRPELIEDAGLPPVPPYIRAARKFANSEISKFGKDEDKKRYQTIYARETGSAAAPTAGLHFTEGLLKDIEGAGAKIARVTLHVGLDTFSPVRAGDIKEHKMHGEEYFVPDETVQAIKRAKSSGGRVIAIGTTSVRALESYYSVSEPVTCHRTLVTSLFITPGYKFKVVDAIFTNFHQPKSTLIMMISAFAGRDLIMKAYAEAIERKYRLFSYGDCMLIL